MPINNNTNKMITLQKIVTNYDRILHGKQMLPQGHVRYEWHNRLQYINPKKWANPANIPYVAASALIDSYSQLPFRPDLGFNSLWSAINSSYNDLYVSSNLSSGDALTDTKSIEFSLERISQRLDHHINIGAADDGSKLEISIREVMRSYFYNAPDKIMHFVASYILKGIAVDKHNVVSPPKAIRKILIPSTYNTFKKKFSKFKLPIEAEMGSKYFNICNISESKDRTDINYGISSINSEKARKLIHATGEELRLAILEYPNPTPFFGDTFNDDKHWLSFMVLAFLYASRNSAVHGNAASRLNSIFSNADSVTSSSWTFLFGYYYLSLVMYCQNIIDIDDLAPHSNNSKLL